MLPVCLFFFVIVADIVGLVVVTMWLIVAMPSLMHASIGVTFEVWLGVGLDRHGIRVPSKAVIVVNWRMRCLWCCRGRLCW